MHSGEMVIIENRVKNICLKTLVLKYAIYLKKAFIFREYN